MRVAQCGHVYHVRVGWMDADLGDVAGIGQSEMAPGLAGVRRAVHAVAMRHVAADAASPIPAYRTFVSLVAIASAPTEARWKNPSETFSQYTPPSVVFHTPPPVEPK